MTDAEQRLAKALDEFFASDGEWSIHDLDGFTEWANQIGYVPTFAANFPETELPYSGQKEES